MVDRRRMQPPIGHIYGYRLEPIEGGTLVTSYYDWSNIHEAYEAMADTVFPVISETNLRATLGILARTVAPGRSRPAPEPAWGCNGAIVRTHESSSRTGGVDSLRRVHTSASGIPMIAVRTAGG